MIVFTGHCDDCEDLVFAISEFFSIDDSALSIVLKERNCQVHLTTDDIFLASKVLHYCAGFARATKRAVKLIQEAKPKTV